MIAKILPRRGPGNGTRSSGKRLMAYLLGPGDKPTGEAGAALAGDGGALGNAHTEPRVVAAWDRGRTGTWGRACAVDWTDPVAAWDTLRALSRRIAEDACQNVDQVRGELDRNAIWHTVMAAHPRDGVLTDGQWAQIAARLMHETKLHEIGSTNPVRWVAVRHGLNEAGADHLHVMAVLVRGDGSRPRMHNDALAAQRAARWAEDTFGLVPGRARSAPRQEREAPVRADTAPTRGDQVATLKAPPPYQRPRGMSDQDWVQVVQEGQSRAWTRRGRARAAVLSAAARAVSEEHLLELVRGQGYAVRLRHSTVNPEQITGWSLVAPADRPGGRPVTYRGAQLGSDCTWTKVSAHVARLSQARGTGLVGEAQEDAVISRETMIAAGWGMAMIDQVLDADRMLAEGSAGPGRAYWLRDAFWQIAWQMEGRYGERGPFTDAAYAYAAVAVGGVPPVPTEALEAMARLRAQYDHVTARLRQLQAEGRQRDAEARAMTRRGQEYDEWANSMGRGAHPHVPGYLLLPGGARLTGAAWLRINLARQRIRQHSAALTQAAAVHRAHTARTLEMCVESQAGLAEARVIGEWITQAKAYEAQLITAIDAHTTAREQWRAAIGRLLIEANALGDTEAVARIEAIDARYGAGATEAGGGVLYEAAAGR